MEPIEQFERAAALKHDLGKYVAWISANFPDDAWSDPFDPELMAALERDILATRKPKQGPAEAAWDVWARLTKGLPRPFCEPELQRVAAAVEVLKQAEQPLRQRALEDIARLGPAIRAAQQEIRAQLRAYHRRLARAI